jgi:hypothetical protein
MLGFSTRPLGLVTLPYQDADFAYLKAAFCLSCSCCSFQPSFCCLFYCSPLTRNPLYNFSPAFSNFSTKNALFHGRYYLLIICFYLFSLRSFTNVHLVSCAPTGSLKVLCLIWLGFQHTFCLACCLLLDGYLFSLHVHSAAGVTVSPKCLSHSTRLHGIRSHKTSSQPPLWRPQIQNKNTSFGWCRMM